MMINSSCNSHTHGKDSFYLLNQDCGIKVPFTVLAVSILAGLSVLLAFLIYMKYSSVRIFNYHVYISAISNNWWLVYFVTVTTRSIVLAVQYETDKTNEAFFLCNWILGSLEVLVLCYALNYQRKFRAVGLVNKEADAASKQNMSKTSLKDCRGFIRVFASSGGLILFQFILVLISIILFACLKCRHVLWFWLYVAFLLLLLFNAFIISCIITSQVGTDSPRWITKIYFMLSVLLTIPEHLPLFIWNQCANIQCWGNVMTVFDFFILIKIVSALMIMRAIHLEYMRLKDHCQYAMLNEVQGYSIEE